jgi:tetratricopeptide (TPR) repeat protein
MEANLTKIDGYLGDLKEHSRAAVSVFNVLENSESQASLRFCVQKFLSEIEGISKILWNNNNKKLRKHIRSVLSIPGDSPFSPTVLSGLRTAFRGIEKTGGIEEKPKNKGIENTPEENIDLQESPAFSYDPGEKILTYDGKNYEILPLFLAAGDLYASLPFFKELQACTEMLEKDPKDATALFQKAVLLYKARRFEDALKLTAHVLEIVPDDYRVWYNRGVILSEMGQLEEALAAYNRTIELEPAFEIAWDNKGVTLAKLGRFKEALETYDKVLLRHPRYAEALAGKGSILSALGNKEEALEAYISALRIRPDYLEALTCTSSLLSRLGRLEESLETYDRALQLAPTEPGLWAGRGLVLLELSRLEDALQSCNRALELKSGFAPALEIKVKVLSEISRQKTGDSQ